MDFRNNGFKYDDISGSGGEWCHDFKLWSTMKVSTLYSSMTNHNDCSIWCPLVVPLFPDFVSPLRHVDPRNTNKLIKLDVNADWTNYFLWLVFTVAMAQGWSQRLVIGGSLVCFPWSAYQSVLRQDTEPWTVPDVLVGTLHGALDKSVLSLLNQLNFIIKL